MLLINPPLVKPCEPPPGIARLSGALMQNGVKCSVWDANIGGILSLLNGPFTSPDRWTSRASRNRLKHIASLQDFSTYSNPDRYRRAVADINRLLEKASPFETVRLTLSNYQDSDLSPVRSRDLINASRNPERNLFYPYFKEKITEIIQKEQPAYIGISLNFLSQALCSFAIIGLIRREWPDLKLILGGGLVTSWIRRPNWINLFGELVDHIVAGPGESFLLSLLANKVDNTQLKGFWRPDYTLFPWNAYISPGPILPYSASSGCYWNRCSFCPERAEKNPYIPVPVDNVEEDLRSLVEKTSPVLIHFLDNALSPGLMNKIVEKPPGVSWYGFARITDHLADQDFCLALKRSGCVMLKLGLESGSQSVLEREQKGVNIKTASSVLRNLKKAGISTYVYLLFGTPSEGEAEARMTHDFVIKHCNYIDFLNTAIFNMPVYGPETSRFETKTMYDGDISLYTGFRHPGGWDRKAVRRFLDREFKRHPSIQEIQRRNPPLFTSNHAPFFRF
ncbi:MAG: radical SAM protein [Deltaproteobacteria bacterium]|nr:radical SAM protein [Deltaproteobacteria bacterium]